MYGRKCGDPNRWARRGSFRWARRGSFWGTADASQCSNIGATERESACQALRRQGFQTRRHAPLKRSKENASGIPTGGTTAPGRPSRRGESHGRTTRGSRRGSRSTRIWRSHGRVSWTTILRERRPGCSGPRRFRRADDRAAPGDRRQPSRSTFRPAPTHRGRDRHLEEHHHLEWRSGMSAVDEGSCPPDVFNLFDAEVSSTTSTSRDCEASPREVSKTSTPHPALPRGTPRDPIFVLRGITSTRPAAVTQRPPGFPGALWPRRDPAA